MMRRIITYMGSRGNIRFRLGKKKAGNERGQVAILFALVFTFMFVLFAFVVDFANIVNAKINLQNAADQAAYAGAAWEARIMNELGQVNYHMRQDVKELGMRLWVTHLRHNRNYPRGSGFINGNPSTPQVEPFICQQAQGYVSLSGVIYQSTTNICRNASPTTGGIPPIVVPPVIAAFDPFNVAINAQIRAIQVKSNQECRAAANDNLQLAQHLAAVYTNRSQFHLQQAQALAGFINAIAAAAGSGPITDGATHPALAAAYQSALRNLTQSNLNGFKLEVLQPRGGRFIDIQPNTMKAAIPYYNFSVEGDGCIGRTRLFDFTDMTAGVTKTQSLVTYFAVKLTATPQMLFMPQSWFDGGDGQNPVFPQLQAFAAAKPFGSRIGPDATADPLLPVSNRPGNNNPLVNFSFKPNDGLGIENTKIMAYLDALHPFNAQGRTDGNQQTGWPEPNKVNNRSALQAIRTPTLFDAIFFTVFPDPGNNIGNDYLEPNFAEALYPDYLEASDPNNQLIETPVPRTPAYFPPEVGSKNRGTGWIQVNADNTVNGTAYGTYATEQLGTHSVESSAELPDIAAKAREFGWADAGVIHSAWAPNNQPGRIGYSVKFVGMDALVRTLRVKLNDSGTEGPIANPPEGDPNIDKIFH